ncbi:hypothetical protein SCLCIDRAFT_1209585 [Scleroderma citrinum Foug A]|uniref:Uncharacterized protein n=1 Tax=Scleroderma citrinum Foug A TaxID=1036808 RepID=A0A0C3A3F5_9AGAM|nr:hypothetical protein SCLCIDRAFT_1209585 [Scleroderma citrinum Foug A]
MTSVTELSQALFESDTGGAPIMADLTAEACSLGPVAPDDLLACVRHNRLAYARIHQQPEFEGHADDNIEQSRCRQVQDHLNHHRKFNNSRHGRDTGQRSIHRACGFRDR